MINVTKFGICAGSLALASMTYGSISFNIAAGTLREAGGAAMDSGIVVLVADADKNGFALPDADNFAGAGDVVVAKWNFSDGGGLPGEFLASGVIPVYEDVVTWDNETGGPAALALFWYPELLPDADKPGVGALFGVFADPDDESEIAGDRWVMPDDGTHLYSLQFFAEGSVLSQTPFADEFVAEATLTETSTFDLVDVLTDPEKTSPTSNTIRWTVPVPSGAQSYSVERSVVGSSAWEKLDSVASNVDFFVDDALVPGAVYQYRVVAINGLMTADWESDEQFISDRSRIVNLATRGVLEQEPYKRRGIGLTLEGVDDMNVLIQAVGPSVPVGPSVAKPSNTHLEFYYAAPRSKITGNVNWDDDVQEAAAILAAQVTTGAQVLNDSMDVQVDRGSGLETVHSGDSALISSINEVDGGYTHRIINPNLDGGICSVQVYDIDYFDGVSGATRFTGLSSRGWVGVGGENLRGSFAIEGEVPMTVMIRVKGPALRDANPNDQYTDSTSLLDPMMTVLKRNTENTEWLPYTTNDDWEQWPGYTKTEINDMVASFGETPFPDGSKDSMVVATFEPGTYHVIVDGVEDASSNPTVGAALLQLYEVR